MRTMRRARVHARFRGANTGRVSCSEGANAAIAFHIGGTKGRGASTLKTPNVKAPPQGKRGLHKRHIGDVSKKLLHYIEVPKELDIYFRYLIDIFHSVEAPLPLAPPMWKAIAALAPLEQETRPVLVPPNQHGKKNDSAANVANGGS
ncbi:hypothetical protein PIB30_003112 [Stylosanthes scabra]|uniref:Uncharacterized protein n=1 Tax=Stylosanthes scabra TaxID=79078 RepID=A0ABU6Y1R4_9FABA|nr:hypothetical protein [Stylosanthes scabra]